MHGTATILLIFAFGVLVGRLTSNRRPARPLQPSGPPPWQAYPAVDTEADTAAGYLQIWLAEPGSNKIATIKAVRCVTRLGLRDAKDLCERAPAPLLRVQTRAEAEAVERQFQNVARLEIRQIPPTSS